MMLEQVKKLSPIERYVYWIKERESIRIKKEVAKVEKPWTDDEILRSYRFCNVVRMDDKVSRWLLKHWYQPHKNHPNMLVACALARHFNRPEALKHITEFVFNDYKPAKVKDVMRQLKSQGNTIFNGAYMVRGIGTADKTEMVVDHVCQPLYDNPPKLYYNSMQGSVEALLPYWGFSNFMAGQVVADLRWATTGSWEDRFRWAASGPGSKRGMNRVHGRPTKCPLGEEQFLAELQRLISQIKPHLPKALAIRMEAIDFQNCLCEYDKYCRVLNGEGTPKQKYPGL